MRWRWALLVAVSLATPHSAAAAERRSPRAPASQTVVVETAWFVLTLPRGWQFARNRGFPEFERAERLECERWADGCRFSLVAADGTYFSVTVDAHTESEPVDRIWKLAPAPSGNAIGSIDEGAACDPKVTAPRDEDTVLPFECRVGDGRLELFAGIELKGHAFGFEFGNLLREEGVPLETFRRVLLSFRATNSRVDDQTELADLFTLAEAPDAPGAWKRFHALYRRSPQNAEGSADENVAYLPALLFANHWKRLDEFASTAKKDQAWKAYVLQLLRFPSDLATLHRALDNSKSCPDRHRALCRSIAASARAALEQVENVDAPP